MGYGEFRAEGGGFLRGLCHMWEGVLVMVGKNLIIEKIYYKWKNYQIWCALQGNGLLIVTVSACPAETAQASATDLARKRKPPERELRGPR